MTKRIARLFSLLGMVGLVAACSACGIMAAPGGKTQYTYRVVNSFPHDTSAFTQGLLYHDGFLYESTGLHGQSSLRKVSLETGVVQQQRNLDSQYFGEGLARLGTCLVQLTWTNGVAFVYNLDTFDVVGQFAYEGEGWGLTHDGQHLIMSDGSNILRFIDPETLEVTGQIPVFDGIQPITRLNELEFIDGQVYANVWMTDEIVIIDPATGALTGRIDLRGLRPTSVPLGRDDVLNGIAYDAANDRLFVTGKRWPLLFELELVPVSR